MGGAGGPDYQKYQANCLSARSSATELKTISGVSRAVAETTLKFTNRYSGDNYRIRAVCRDPNNKPFDSRSGTTSINTDASDLNAVTTGIKPANNPLIHESYTLVAWKRIYLEYDQMYKMGGTILAGAGATVTVDDATDFVVGQTVSVFNNTGGSESATIKTKIGNDLEFDAALAGVYLMYSGVRPTHAPTGGVITGAGDLYEVTLDFDQAYGRNPDGSDGGAFLEFVYDASRITGGGAVPKYKQFPNEIVIEEFDDHWSSHPRTDDNICQIMASTQKHIESLGTAYRGQNRINIWVDKHSAYAIAVRANGLLDTVNHELGHISGSLPKGWNGYVDEYVNYKNHEISDECIMSYNTDDIDGIMEFSTDALNEIRNRLLR